MQENRERFLEFVNQRMARPENKWRSFTYWSAMYTWIREDRFTFEYLWIYDEIVQYVCNISWASYDRVEWLNDNALAEIVDISVLQEFWEEIDAEYQEGKRQELKDFLTDIVDDWKVENIDQLYQKADEWHETEIVEFDEWLHSLVEDIADDEWWFL